jgi:hypothetical protein
MYSLLAAGGRRKARDDGRPRLVLADAHPVKDRDLGSDELG